MSEEQLARIKRDRFEKLLEQLSLRYEALYGEPVKAALLTYLEETLRERRRVTLNESLSTLDTEDLLYLFKLYLKQGAPPAIIKEETPELPIQEDVPTTKSFVVKRRAGRPRKNG